MEHFVLPSYFMCNTTTIIIYFRCIAETSTASLQEEIKQKACDTESEHIETVLTCKCKTLSEPDHA